MWMIPRKCVISMWVVIKDKTYPAQGDYVFEGMSETQACEFSKTKAKEQVIREVSQPSCLPILTCHASREM